MVPVLLTLLSALSTAFSLAATTSCFPLSRDESLTYPVGKASEDGPVVNVSFGAFSGKRNPADSRLEIFRGIPFAVPPLGALRFKAPQPIQKRFRGLQDATKFAPACAQNPEGDLFGGISEDCLTFDVSRPANTTEHSKLPLLVWFFGGAWNHGWSSSNDSTSLLQRGVETDKPFVFVAVNCRLNSFGFLSSFSLPPEDLNAGLEDQNLALKVLRREAAAFGGDPEKITIWGQSSGAASVGYHLVFGNRSENLFRSAIMDSGSPMMRPLNPPEASENSGQEYNLLGKLTNCTGRPSQTLECLRHLPFHFLNNATVSVTKAMQSVYPAYEPWIPTLGGSFITKRGSEKIMDDDWYRIPVLTGTNNDEGTTFTAPWSNSTKEVNHQVIINVYSKNTSTFPKNILSELDTLYPNDPSLGSPFGTGNRTFGVNAQFKRAAAIMTDTTFLAPRRFLTNRTAERGQPTWVYLFDQTLPGANPRNGVSHSAELDFFYTNLTRSPKNSQAIIDLSKRMMDHWLSFVYYQDPGKTWPRYTASSRTVLHFKSGNVSTIADDFRLENTKYINEPDVLQAFGV